MFRLLAASVLLALGETPVSAAYFLSVIPDQASFAANNGNVTGQQNPLEFDAIYVNIGGALDQETWRLHIQTWGLYLVTFSAGHPGAGGTTNMSLQRDDTIMTSVYRGGVSGAMADTFGLDIVSFFSQHEELHIRSDSTSLVSTALGKLTSWGAVSLSEHMGVLVGFGVAKTTSHAPGKISFDRVWANVGNGWDSANNVFTAPLSGIYFLSFTSGIPLSQVHTLRLRVNGNSIVYAQRARRLPYTIDFYGRSVMINLLENDQVYIYSDYNGYSDSGCLTTFSGFLYSTLRSDQLAWAVYRTASYSGSADPLAYDHVEVNEGGVWGNNRATCSITGLYFVHLSVGINYNSEVQLTIMKDSQPQGEFRRVGAVNYVDVLSRSLIIKCNAGETLRVVSSSNTGLFGDWGKHNAFIGFYLFP